MANFKVTLLLNVGNQEPEEVVKQVEAKNEENALIKAKSELEGVGVLREDVEKV